MGNIVNSVFEASAAQVRGLLASRSLAVQTRIHLDASTSAIYRDGSRQSPFKTLDELQVALANIVGPIEIRVRSGQYRGAIQIDSDRVTELRIVGEVGASVQILGSRQVTSGWVQHSTISSVWSIPHQWNSVTPSSEASFGVLDISPDAAQTTGYNDSYTLPWKTYAAMPVGTSLTALGAQSYRCTVSTGDQKLYINPGPVDPNTRVLELCDKDYAIRISPSGSDGGSWAMVNVEIDNIEARYARINNLYIEKARVSLNECKALGAFVGEGFMIKNSGGCIRRCIAEGNYADGFHNGGADSTGLPVPPATIFEHCESNGALAPAGDGYSNHTGAAWTFLHCRAKGNRKSGWSPAYGDLELIDCIGDKNALAGVFGAVGSDRDVSLRIVGGCYSGGFAGIQLNFAAASTKHLVVDILRPTLLGNERGIYIFNAGAASMISGRIVDPKYAGNSSFTIATLAQSTITVTSSLTSS